MQGDASPTNSEEGRHIQFYTHLWAASTLALVTEVAFLFKFHLEHRKNSKTSFSLASWKPYPKGKRITRRLIWNIKIRITFLNFPISTTYRKNCSPGPLHFFEENQSKSLDEIFPFVAKVRNRSAKYRYFRLDCNVSVFNVKKKVFF